jgi:K+-sensing histidine kinase KdpD
MKEVTTRMRARAVSAEERLARMIELQSMLARVAGEIGPALELQPVLATVLAAMRRLVDFKGGTIQLVGPDGIRVAAADPPVSDDVLESRLAVGSGISGRVVQTGEAHYSPDLRTDERVDQAQARLGSNAPSHSYLAVPLVSLGKTIGALQIDSNEIDAFDADDLQVLLGLAAQVAGAIESAQRNEAVLQLERLKSRFLAQVSHELRTPLTIIAGFIHTILNYEGQLEARQQRQMLHRIEAATNRLNTLIEEMLTVTQFEAGAIAPRPMTVVLSEVLGEVRDNAMEPELVTVRCPVELEVFVDPKLLRLAVGHLVDNALKYAGDAELVAGVDEKTQGPYLDVRDHGPGVPLEMREAIFESFMRGDHTEPGMGLGLPLVKMMAGGLGVKVELLSPAGGGACFRLLFPV